MASLDTNVLVRWLMNDDPPQCRLIERVLLKARRQQEALFVPVTVLLELEWVLRTRYDIDKQNVLLAMNALLDSHDLQIQSEPAVERALYQFRLHAADFADCLHASLCSAEGQAPLLTFDRRAARLPGAERLTA